MKDRLLMVNRMVKEELSIEIYLIIRENFNREFSMEKGHFKNLKDLNIQVHLKKEYLKVLEMKFGPMELLIKGIIKVDKKMEWGNLLGLVNRVKQLNNLKLHRLLPQQEIRTLQ
jgi:hypothetical protein